MKGNKVISASSDSNLIIWNLEIEKRMKVDGTTDEKLKARLVDFKMLMGHLSDIYSFDIYGDYIARYYIYLQVWLNKRWPYESIRV